MSFTYIFYEKKITATPLVLRARRLRGDGPEGDLMLMSARARCNSVFLPSSKAYMSDDQSIACVLFLGRKCHRSVDDVALVCAEPIYIYICMYTKHCKHVFDYSSCDSSIYFPRLQPYLLVNVAFFISIFCSAVFFDSVKRHN